MSFNHDGTLIVSCAMDGLMWVEALIWLLRTIIKLIWTQTNMGCGLWPMPKNSGRRWQSNLVYKSHHEWQEPSRLIKYSSSHVKFSPNSKFVLASTQDSTIRLWNYHTSRCVKTYTGHVNRTYCLLTCFSKGKYIISGSEDAKIFIWDLQSRQVLQVLEGHRGELVLR